MSDRITSSRRGLETRRTALRQLPARLEGKNLRFTPEDYAMTSRTWKPRRHDNLKAGALIMASSLGRNAQPLKASPARSVVRGSSRIPGLPVATVIGNLGDLSVEEAMEQFDVTQEQIASQPLEPPQRFSPCFSRIGWVNAAEKKEQSK